MTSRILKRHLQVLERVFAAEIARALDHGPNLPIQVGNSKAVRECVEMGLLEPVEGKHPAGPFTMTVSGHELTHAGRYAYCATCDEPA